MSHYKTINTMKNLLVTMLLAAVSITGYAQEWIDVTDGFIINPRYDNNLYHGWMGTELAHYNPHENAEFWNYWSFHTYQNISGLPEGKYRLSLDAFFRMGNSENDYQLWAAGKDTYEPHRIAYLYPRCADVEITRHPSPVDHLGSGK